MPRVTKVLDNPGREAGPVGLAQLVARVLWEHEVAGSNPASCNPPPTYQMRRI